MTLALDRFSRNLQRWHSSRVEQNHRDLDWDIKARIKKDLDWECMPGPSLNNPEKNLTVF